MKINKLITVTICCLMALITLFRTSIPAIAAETKLYIKEVITSIGENSASAKKWLTDRGYTVLDSDLNAGTGEYPIYLGYKTTTKKSEAITDISIMDMNGGYELMDYAAFAEQNQANIAQMTYNLRVACAEMRANLQKGNRAAQTALDYLNIFTVPEAKMPLGDYLLDTKRTDGDYRMILLVCNSLVISIIYAELSLGCSDYGGDVWAKRLADLGIDDTDEDETDYWQAKHDLYYDDALGLYKILVSYREQYLAALERKAANGGEVVTVEASEDDAHDAIESFVKTGEPADPAANDALVLSVIEYLNGFEYGSEHLGDALMNIAAMEESEETVALLYQLASVLTPAQQTLMCIEGLTTFTSVNLVDDAALETLNGDLAGYKNDLLAALDSDTASVWIGTNRDVYDGKIALTSEARRNAAAANDYEKITYVSDFDLNIKVALCYIGGAAAAASGVTLIIFGVGGIVIKTAVALSICSTVSTIVSAVALGCIGMIGIAVSLLVIAALVVCAIVYAVDCIIDIYNYYHPEYTDIPTIVVDSCENGYITYRAVTDRGFRNTDVNVWEGKKWNALYYTTDTAAGSPLVVDDLGKCFKVVYGSTKVPEGMTAVKRFGTQIAVNLNADTYDDDVGGIYLYYTAEEANNEPKQEGVYLESLTMLCHESASVVRDLLTIKGYKILDFNLTSDTDYATYIGYTTTTNAANAITDIRVSYAGTDGKYYYGDVTDTYGYAGGNTLTTENESTELLLSLYYTKSQKRGTPIYANLLATKNGTTPIGYEPVNTFSGGGAFDFNTYLEESPSDWKNHAYVYFEPSVSYDETNSELYLGGIAFVSGSTDMDYGKLENYAKEIGMTICNIDLTKGFFNDEDRTWLCYSTTYNPYRAIYDIGVYTCEYKSQSMPENVVLDNVGYSACQTYTQGDRSYYGNIFWGGNYRIIRPTHAYISNNEDYGGDDEYGDTLVCNRGMYVCGPENGKLPIRMSTLTFSKSAAIPYGCVAVHDMTDKFATKALNLALYDGDNKNSLYITYEGTAPVKQKYISKITVVTSKAEDFAYDKTMYKLMSLGGDEIIKINLAELKSESWQNASYAAGFDEDSDLDDYEDSVGYIRVTRTSVKNQAIGSIVIYKTSGSAPDTMNFRYDETDKTTAFTKSGDGISYCGGTKYYFYYAKVGNKINEFTVDTKMYNANYATVIGQDSKVYTDLGYFFHTFSDAALPYYTAFNIASGDNETMVIKSLLESGCNEVKRISQSGKATYIGYVRTSSTSKAVRNILFSTSATDTLTVDDVTYTKCGRANGITLYQTTEGVKTKAIVYFAFGSAAPNQSNYPEGTCFEYVQDAGGKKADIASAVGAKSPYYAFVSHKDNSAYASNAYYASVVTKKISVIFVIAMLAVMAIGVIIFVIIKTKHKKGDAEQKACSVQKV